CQAKYLLSIEEIAFESAPRFWGLIRLERSCCVGTIDNPVPTDAIPRKSYCSCRLAPVRRSSTRSVCQKRSRNVLKSRNLVPVSELRSHARTGDNEPSPIAIPRSSSRASDATIFRATTAESLQPDGSLGSFQTEELVH